jgi:hypothetical protein
VSHDSESESMNAEEAIEEPEATHRPLCPEWWAIHPKIAAAYTAALQTPTPSRSAASSSTARPSAHRTSTPPPPC